MEPITRREMYLAAAAGYDVDPPEPITREEVFLAKLAGMDVDTPVPFTRRERFIEEAAVAANKAVIEPLTITENGTYTAPDGVDGYNPVTVEVDPTKITILKEQQFDGFVMDSTFGAYSPGYVTPAPFTLNSGETYHVIWDNIERECTAFAFDMSGLPIVAIGNGTSLGLQGNNEPFLITYNESYDNTQLFSTDANSSHTVGIWQKVTQEINLQDKTITENGEYTADNGFDGLGKVTVDVAGSGGLPSGLYLRSYDIPSALGSYAQKLFKINDVFYSLVWPYAIDSTTKQYDLYKYASGTWSKVNSSRYTINNFYYADGRMAECEVVEFNGKAHIFNAELNVCIHIALDGQGNLTTYAKPVSTGNVKPFVEDGQLKAVLYSTPYTVYVWNEANDTWTQSGTLPTSGGSWYGGEYYYSKSEKSDTGKYVDVVYKWKDGVSTKLCVSSGSISRIIAVKNNCLYHKQGSLSDKEYTIYEVDLASGENKMIGKVSNVRGAQFYAFDDDTPMLYWGGNYAYYCIFWANYALQIIHD